jgi:hypothetical protein
MNVYEIITEHILGKLKEGDGPLAQAMAGQRSWYAAESSHGPRVSGHDETAPVA